MNNRGKKIIAISIVICMTLLNTINMTYADEINIDEIDEIKDKLKNNGDKIEDFTDKMNDESEDVNCGKDTKEYIDQLNHYRKTKEAVVLKINNAEEFMEFAKNCEFDAYSINLTVELMSNINLENLEFANIPIFLGTFNGNNHTITKLKVDDSLSNCGLFRVVGEGAIVRDLNVSGDIKTAEKTRNVGMIVGVNSGLIKNCKAIGNMEAHYNTGGIVGQNKETGLIKNCTNNVKIFSEKYTGGIAGVNFGTVSKCKNYGAVNIIENENSENTGGIVGKNVGSIDNCENKSNVGYNHTGYNVGGISGLNDGVIISCENYGIIQGRKDIGGIAGQFEPSVDLQHGNNPITNLNDALDGMSRNANALNNELKYSSDTSLDEIQMINDSVDAIQEVVHGAVDVETDSYNKFSDEFSVYTTSINASLDELIDLYSEFNDLFLSKMEVIDRRLLYLRADCENIYFHTDANIKQAISYIDDTESQIKNSRKIIDEEMKDIAADTEQYEEFISKVSDIVADDINYPNTIDKISAIGDEIGKLDTTDISNSIEKISTEVTNIGDAISSLHKNLKNLYDKQSEQINNQVNNIDDDLNRIDYASDEIRQGYAAFSRSALIEADNINDRVLECENLIKEYTQSVSNNLDKNSDSVDVQMKNINDRLDGLNATLDTSNDNVHKYLNNISYNFDILRTSVSDMLSPPKKEFKDISEIIEYEGDAGRIILCSNNNKIYGDANIGGIAGIVASEFGLDPEEDLDSIDSDIFVVDTTAFVKATVRGCENRAAVIVKNNYAGGIVGRADVGAILDCINLANINCDEADFVGGIVGSSKVLVTMCYSLSDIEANSNVGGIAGEANDIRKCLSMTRIISDGEKLGSIAGTVIGECSENYFVDEGVAGVDSANYIFKAEPVTYEEMVKMENVPNEFRQFEVVFKVDSKVLKILKVDYNDMVTDAMIPAIPVKDGYYAVWSSIERKIFRNQVVDAVYEKYISSISSNEDIPYVLLEGDFTDKCQVSVNKLDIDNIGMDVPKNYIFVSGLELEFTRDDKILIQNNEISINAEGAEKIKNVYIMNEAGEIIKPQIADSYVKINAENNGKYMIIEKIDYIAILLKYMLIALAAMVVFLIIKKKRKNRKKSK